MTFSEKVYEATKKIPKGKITTYKLIAKYLNTKAYRAVGTALKRNPYSYLNRNHSSRLVPCHRVVKTNGQIGGFSGFKKGKYIKEKIKLLLDEKIYIKNNKVVNFDNKLYSY